MKLVSVVCNFMAWFKSLIYRLETALGQELTLEEAPNLTTTRLESKPLIETCCYSLARPHKL